MTSDSRVTHGRGRIYDSIVDTIGDTPVIRINHLAPEGVEMFVKFEAFNPAASVKDRLAISIIEEAERDGSLKPGQTVIEATSGNTGIGLAMVCAAKGYPLVVTMAETFSVERRQLMRMLGAKVILTPKEVGGVGMYKKARELADAHGWFWAGQFETAANAKIHANTTAREILADFADRRLDMVVTGFGTGGTVTGIGRVLREARPDVKIMLSEPSNAQMVASGVAQERTEAGEPEGKHPAFEIHPIQGWSPPFIPLVLQEAIDKGYYDQLVPVDAKDGMHWSRQLAAREGILTGISGGCTFAIAMDLAKAAEPGSAILTMLPDTGERYLSTPLFEPFPTEMSDEEKQIAASTPGYQFG
jgi:cysteine synthase A